MNQIKITIPKIKLSEWFKWSERVKIKNINFPGVYILAKFKKAPKGNANTADKNIIYIGETCSALNKRLQAFNRCAFKKGHSGGVSYKKLFKDKSDDLYVSAFPIELPNNLNNLFIRHTERKLIFSNSRSTFKQPTLAILNFNLS